MFYLLFALVTLPEMAELRRVEDWEILLSKALQAASQDREESERIYRRAVDAAEEHQFPALLRAKAHNNYGSLLHQTGRYELAVTEYERAAGFWRMAYGPASDDLATTLNNLAEVERLAGRYERAEKLYNESLAMREGSAVKSRLKQATTLSNLGTMLRSQKQYERAQEAHERALAIRLGGLPDNHPDIANSLNNLGTVRQDRGDLEGAEAAYRKALTIRQGNPPGEALASALNNLGTLLRKRNLLDEAFELIQRAQEVALPILGREHPTVAAIWSNLGDLEVGRGHLLEAEPWYRQALAVSEAKLGPMHPQTLTIVENLGSLFLQQAKATGAEALFRRVLKVDAADGNTRHHLAQALLLQHRWTEAEILLSGLLPELGAQPDRASFVLTELASVYLQKQDFVRAERALGEASALVRGLSATSQAPIAAAYQAYARMLRERRRAKDAERVESLIMGLR